MIIKRCKSLFRVLLVLLLPIVLSGCWERKELNEMAFVLGLGLDKAEAGYKVSMQVVIPSAITSQASGGSGGGGVPVVLYSFTARTFYDALRQFNLVCSRRSYLGHIRALVIGEELARSGVGEILDVIKRSREPRMDFYVMVARDTTAENVLKVLTPLDKIPANKLFNALDKSYKISSRTVAVTLDRFIEDLLYEGEAPVLTGVEIKGDVDEGSKKSNIDQTAPKTRLRYQNVALFKKDKLIGWLTGEATAGYNYIINKVHQSSGYVLGTDGQPVVIEALQTSTKLKVQFIDGKPHIYIKVKATCNVEEVQSKENLEEENSIRDLERKTEETIIMRMQDAVEEINKQFKVDAMGFGQAIYRANPRVWAKLKAEQGDQYLQRLPVHYKASVRINRIGTMDKTFLDEIKE
ncbi:Ger(x)C family spore germination protein [Paenibacillus sp. HW567]|uniref:Ger(x)C family spore germination protein n=1 Tax=Paenibacillus sp. HW567 TaxID=1034769 RepID=UPI00036CF536|nr:Ger(x)C family spore germination protein [Paenibacillus sp. HW567]